MTPAASVAPLRANFAEQVTLGQQLYGAQCAGCHGNVRRRHQRRPRRRRPRQGRAPARSGSHGEVQKIEFKTVADIAEFVVKSMPPKAPGSLTAEEYFAILAFDLKANGIDLGDKKLDGELAKTLEVPRK